MIVTCEDVSGLVNGAITIFTNWLSDVGITELTFPTLIPFG